MLVDSDLNPMEVWRTKRYDSLLSAPESIYHIYYYQCIYSFLWSHFLFVQDGSDRKLGVCLAQEHNLDGDKFWKLMCSEELASFLFVPQFFSIYQHTIYYELLDTLLKQTDNALQYTDKCWIVSFTFKMDLYTFLYFIFLEICLFIKWLG